jgi:hypothetical protein
LCLAGVIGAFTHFWWWDVPPQQTHTDRETGSARYVGQKVCAECHTDIAANYAITPMGQAATSAGNCRIFLKYPHLSFKLGRYTYQITSRGRQTIYSISDGEQTITEPILWCFGRGEIAYTFVIRHQGAFYETRLSFYHQSQQLDFTPGAPRDVPLSLADAVGQPMNEQEARSCFGCHTTPAPGTAGMQLDQIDPGVGCESCHGPGENHLAALRNGQRDKDGKLIEKRIFNPQRMSPDNLTQQLCGRCHRSWDQVMRMPERHQVVNVRFQPYRIAKSKCYRSLEDARISCTACHNPHEDLKRDAAFYDARCLACHRSAGKATKNEVVRQTAPPCPTGKSNCASCHMPRIEVPEMQFKFTDHNIRIVKPGEEYPR